MPIHLQNIAGYNHPNDKIEQDRKNASIYHRFVGSLNKSFKFKYHEFRPEGYDTLVAFNDMDERKLMDEYWLPFINKNSVVVDVGASYGIYTLVSALAGAAKVHAFEPIKIVADILRKNIELNGWEERININEKLLWCVSDVDVKFDDKKMGSVIQLVETPIVMRSVALDDLNLDKIDLLKIDVEGAELEVLYGAIKTINKYRPRILIEVHEQWVKNLEESIKHFFNISAQTAPTITTIIKDRKYMIIEFE